MCNKYFPSRCLWFSKFGHFMVLLLFKSNPLVQSVFTLLYSINKDWITWGHIPNSNHDLYSWSAWFRDRSLPFKTKSLTGAGTGRICYTFLPILVEPI